MKQTKFYVTLICFVLMLGSMLVGVYAALQQNVGFSAKISFRASDISCEMIGKIYGTTEDADPTLNLIKVTPTTTSGTQSWTINGSKNENGSLSPSSANNYTIKFCIAIRNTASVGGTGFWIFPTQKATAISNMKAVTYRQYVIDNVTSTLSAGNVSTYQSSNLAMEKNIDISATTNLPYYSNSDGSFGLRNVDTATTNELQPNQVFYFEFEYKVDNVYQGISATSITFDMLLTSKKDTIVANSQPASTNLGYTASGNYYTLSGIGTSTSTELVIPAIYNSKYVTAIASSAMLGKTALTSVSIPSSVTSVGDSAFSGCSNLTSVTIPSSVTTLGASVFNGCTSISRFIIPSTLTTMGATAFNGWTSSQNIYVLGLSTRPSGWSSAWNSGSNAVVTWNP